MNTPPTFGLSHNLCKNISNSSNVPFFWSPIPPPICNWAGVQTIYLLSSRNLKIEILKVSSILNLTVQVTKTLIHRTWVDSVFPPHLISQPIPITIKNDFPYNIYKSMANTNSKEHVLLMD